jgi:hypothetical protein
MLQDDLAEVETYKGAGGIWLSSQASKHIPEGQATMQEAFENTATRVRALVGELQNEDDSPKQSTVLVIQAADSSDGHISPALMPTYNTLVNMVDQFRAYVGKKGILSEEELVHFYWLQFDLNQVESTLRHEGAWASNLQYESALAGQACVHEQVELCHTLAHRISVSREIHCQTKSREIYCQTKSMEDLKPQNRRAINIWREMKCT